ncbi:MAG: aromatic amino acid transaminase [Arenicella sp.]
MFERLPYLPADPILGLMSAFNADTTEHKVDLGAGVYKNESGETPIMQAVTQAQSIWAKQESTKSYAAPAGFTDFNEGIVELLLGEKHPALIAQRVASIQTTGGCAALSIAAGMLKRCKEDVKIWVSNPTWANHTPLLSGAGLELVEYPYYNFDTNEIDFDAMMSTLSNASQGDLVLLHGCCHNPSGADLNKQQWHEICQLLIKQGAIPFVDIAYQGLGDGLDKDAYGLRHLAQECPEMIIASSCSKNFGLYRERVGAIVVVAKHKDTASVCQGQLLNVVRQIYSMPPSHGAALVGIILKSADLTAVWQQELLNMRQRISDLRLTLTQHLATAGAGGRFDYIKKEKGMFSFLGISREQVHTLKQEHNIYMVDSSRINVAGLNKANMDYVVDSLLRVI